MVCIYCGSETSVTNSRLQKKSNNVWRRRFCSDCKATVTTLESIDLKTAIIVTDQKHQEAFVRDKLFISIFNACKHRKDALASASALTDTIIINILSRISNASISRDDIIKIATVVLTRFDKVAGVQYTAYHPTHNN